MRLRGLWLTSDVAVTVSFESNTEPPVRCHNVNAAWSERLAYHRRRVTLEQGKKQQRVRHQPLKPTQHVKARIVLCGQWRLDHTLTRRMPKRVIMLVELFRCYSDP
jgi:hypothetical protein